MPVTHTMAAMMLMMGIYLVNLPDFIIITIYQILYNFKLEGYVQI